ncbi:MAG: replication initiation protein [Bacteroidota bacterium]
MAKKKQTPSDSLIVKDNKLINARYSLSVAEMRLFLMMVAQVRREDKDFTTYRIRISDFMDKLETNSKSVYDRAKEKSKRLMEKVLEIEEPDGKLQIALLSSAKYYSGKGYVDLRFDPALKPYLLQLKEKFTSYDIKYVLKLQSAHSIRIYELLKQYERIGERKIEVDELKEMLDLVGKYRSYNYFKKRVILQAQEELAEKSDIRFEFEELKEGRRVTSIRFFIYQQRDKQRTASPVEVREADVSTELKSMGLSPKQISRFLTELPEDEIQKAIAYTRQQLEEGKIKSSIGGYLKTILESGGVGESKLKKTARKKKAETQQRLSQQREEAERIREWEDRFDELRRQEVESLSKQASEQDWQQFADWAEDNIFVKAKVFDKGHLKRKSEDTQFWFRSFLSDRLPARHPAFIKWVYEETGFQLRQIEENGKERYQIVGKQGALFE